MYTHTYLHTINIVCIAECSLQLYLCPCKIEYSSNTRSERKKERKLYVHLMIYASYFIYNILLRTVL